MNDEYVKKLYNEIRENLDGDYKIILEPWEQFVIACIFGWRRKENKLRRFKKAYVQVSRKNGKTTFASGIGNYCFFCDSPVESGVEIYYIRQFAVSQVVALHTERVS